MTRVEYKKASPVEVADWLSSRGWVRYEFMGWKFEGRGRITHCNTKGAVDLQLRRDAQRARSSKKQEET